jgi:chromosome segregation ATPase
LLLSLGMAVSPAHAQVSRGGGEASAILMQQYQQLSSERSQLQAENAKLKADLVTAKSQLDASNKELGSLKAGTHRDSLLLEASKTKEESDQKALADARANLNQLVDRFRGLAATLKETESERAELKARLETAATAFDVCADRNDALFQVTSEVLNRYEHQGSFSCLARDEPFTRLKRIQIENLTDDYRQRAAELRLKRSTPPAPPSALPPGPSPAAPPSAAPRS